MFLTPNPIFLSFGGIEIRWYAVCILTGVLAAMLVCAKRLKKLNIDPEILYDFLIVCMPTAIICARLYYVIFKFTYYSNHLGDIIKIWNGGLAIHGGLIGIFLGMYFVCKHHKLNMLQMLDVGAPTILLAQAIGRWGNYFNMEAYGGETALPWAINVIDPVKGSIYVHPTFLYESIWNIIGFFIMILLLEKFFKKNDGELICCYFIYYSIGRFLIETLRTDSLMFFGLKTAQLVSLGLILLGIVGIILIRKNAKSLNNGSKNVKKEGKV